MSLSLLYTHHTIGTCSKRLKTKRHIANSACSVGIVLSRVCCPHYWSPMRIHKNPKQITSTELYRFEIEYECIGSSFELVVDRSKIAVHILAVESESNLCLEWNIGSYRSVTESISQSDKQINCSLRNSQKMKKISVILVLVVVCGLFSAIYARTANDLRITLSNGNKLVGRSLRSINGRPIKAFMGIPYAKPPVGERRFKVK